MRLARPARCGGDAGGPGPAAAFAARPKDLWRTPRTGCRPDRSRPRGPPCVDAVPTAPRRALPPSSTGSTRAVLQGRSVTGGEATRALWIAEPCCSPRARAVSRARRLDRFCLRRVPREHDRNAPSTLAEPRAAIGMADAELRRTSGAGSDAAAREDGAPCPCRPTRSTRSCELPAGSPGPLRRRAGTGVDRSSTPSSSPDVPRPRRRLGTTHASRPVTRPTPAHPERWRRRAP